MTGAPPIQVVPLRDHAPDPQTIAVLAASLEEYLRVPVEVLQPIQLPEGACVGAQLSSNIIVDSLIERFDGTADRWALAVTAADLVAPRRDFVFGEAALGGRWAVVSSARLTHERNPGKTAERLFKESLHELAHLAGLGHCASAGCIMRRSATVADVDSKSEFCQKCVSAFFHSARS